MLTAYFGRVPAMETADASEETAQTHPKLLADCETARLNRPYAPSLHHLHKSMPTLSASRHQIGIALQDSPFAYSVDT